MEIILSAAVSLDGYLDDLSPRRLKLSSPEDWAAVQELRASCDAILVGAGTVRKDNPSLVIREEQMRKRRIAEGISADIVKITITKSGDIDPDAAFFREGGGHKIVFASESADAAKLKRIESYCEIVKAEKITPKFIHDTLAAKGYKRLMVEGGGEIHTMFLMAGLADRLRLAIAPIFVGEQGAPRFVRDGMFPWQGDSRMTLENVEMLGDMAVMHYNLKR